MESKCDEDLYYAVTDNLLGTETFKMYSTKWLIALYMTQFVGEMERLLFHNVQHLATLSSYVVDDER